MAGYTGSTSAPISWPYIVAGQRVAFRAMRLELVRQTAFAGGIKQVFSLCPDEEMGWVDAPPIVALVTYDSASGDFTVEELPRITVSGDVASDPEAAITTLTEKPRPRPTPVGLLNLRPEPSLDIHARKPPFGVDQSTTKWWKNLQLVPDSQVAKHNFSWSTPKEVAPAGAL